MLHLRRTSSGGFMRGCVWDYFSGGNGDLLHWQPQGESKKVLLFFFHMLNYSFKHHKKQPFSGIDIVIALESLLLGVSQPGLTK